MRAPCIHRPPHVFVLALAASVATVSSARAVTPPYVEDFETEPVCNASPCTNACTLSTSGWTNATADSRDWFVDFGGTGSFPFSGPSVDHNPGTGLGHYLHLETSSPCLFQNFTASLLSPVLELSGTTSPSARFWYHQHGAHIGQLRVDVLDATATNVLTANVIAPVVGLDVDQWFQTPAIDLSPYIGQDVVVRIRGTHSGDGVDGDMAVDDFRFVDLDAVDVGTELIVSPITECGLGVEAVTATFTNFGSAVVNDVDVSFVVDGGAPVVEQISIPAASSVEHTFATTADFSGLGAHTLTVSVAAAGDVLASNDARSATVSNLGTGYLTAPFVDDFEGASVGDAWTVTGANTSWALGPPAQTLIHAAASGNNAWMTGLSTDYQPNELGAVETTCGMDLTGLTEPYVILRYRVETQTSVNDGANVQYRVDDGPWTTLGDHTTGLINGYNRLYASGLLFDVAWVGSNGDYRYAVEPIPPSLLTETNVRFRVQFGANDDGVEGEGFAFDDFQIADGLPPGAQIEPFAPPIAQEGGVAQGEQLLVHALRVDVLGGFSPATVSLTNGGTIADGEVTWHIWVDNGDGYFDGGTDTLVDSQLQTAGAVTFDTTAAELPSGGTVWMWIVAEVDPAATPTSTIDATVTGVTSADPLLAPLPAVSSTPHPVIPAIAALPYADDFSSFAPEVAIYTAAGHQLPTLAGLGTVFTGNTYEHDGQAQLVATSVGLTPVEGNQLLQLDYPMGSAGVSIQYMFDLSAYAAESDVVWLSLRYADHMDENDPEENVFVSTDGGLSYLSVYDLQPGSLPDDTWSEIVVDLSSALTMAGSDFSDRTMIRWNGTDSSPISIDGLLFDALFVGRAPRTMVDRMGAPLDDDGTDDLGSTPAVTQSLTYTVTNGGHYDLNLVGITSSNASGVENLVVGSPATTTVAPGMTTTFLVEFDPTVAPFSVDIDVEAEDPHLADAVYTFTIGGTGVEPVPEIDVRSGAASIPAGSTLDVGLVDPGVEQMAAYTIASTGDLDLEVAEVQTSNASNATAGLDTPPSTTVAPGNTSDFSVAYTVAEPGPFAFDIVIGSNDADESPFTITLIGAGVGVDEDTSRGAGGMGSGGAGGSATVDGPVAPSPDEDGGCSCRVPGGGRRGAPWGIATLVGWGLVSARRRRRPGRSQAGRGRAA